MKKYILDCNTIVETRNAKFFEHIYPLSEEIFHAYVNRNTNESVDVTFNEELIRSKRARKEISFGDDFVTYPIDGDPITYFDTISSSNSALWKEVIGNEIMSLLQNSDLGISWLTSYNKSHWLQMNF